MSPTILWRLDPRDSFVPRLKVLLADLRLPRDGSWLTGVFSEEPEFIAFPGEGIEELKQAVGDADCVICGTTRITREIIQAGKRLRLVQKAGLRYENIDLEAAKEAKVPVCVARRLSRIQIAEHSFALLLALQRKIFQGHSDVIHCDYEKRGLKPIVTDQRRFVANWMGYKGIETLFGKTLGVLGMGEIGTEVALRGEAFGMQILYYQRHRIDSRAENELGATYVTFDALLGQADVLTVCVPQTPETERMIATEQFSMMKQSSSLINVSKGAVVDENALARALISGQIAGAGLDVFCEEPLPKGSQLLDLKNVVLTPHIAMGYMAGGKFGDEIKMVFSNVARLAQELKLEGRVA